ncbi:metalloprotease [Cladochytrium replicatum]|nr:metalloprotease [Cladochytrium replicatum]
MMPTNSILNTAIFLLLLRSIEIQAYPFNGTNNLIFRCGSTPSANKSKATEIRIQSAIANAVSAFDNSAGSIQSAVIPTYFHVISGGPGKLHGDIPVENIKAQILCSTPTMLVCSALNLVENATWFQSAEPESDVQAEMKRSLRRGGVESLNIYSVNLTAAGLLGFATFPFDLGTNVSDDGVVVLFSSFPNGTMERYNLGKTVTHEYSSFFVLGTGQGRCDDVNGDYVDDTPAEKSPANGCAVGRDSCPSLPGADPITNFMDYSDVRHEIVHSGTGN